MDFTSHTYEDVSKILKEIGFSSMKELISGIIPADLLLDRPLDMPDSLSESELWEHFFTLSTQSSSSSEVISFLGGGAYDHYIPAAVGNIISRSEFVTAYTPYQAEVAQGTLQTIYEFQTMIARLMGMDAANASHYDGATALAEAVLLAVKKTRKLKVLVPEGLNPNYRQVIETYCRPSGIEIQEIKANDGCIDLVYLENQAVGSGAIVVQHPNYFGLFEPVEKISEIAHKDKALVISSTNPTSLALLKPPGEWGSDIATAEGQSFGIPTAFGGPYLGLFAVKKPFIRQMPGRLVARAVDSKGRDGFVLTLQTREQHIRREKATSNICTNQALMALNALVYLSLLGRDGLKKVALNSYRTAHYLAAELSRIKGCKVRFKGDFFNEFVLQLPVSGNDARQQLSERGIMIGPLPGDWFPDLSDCTLIAVTERRTKSDCEALIEGIKKL